MFLIGKRENHSVGTKKRGVNRRITIGPNSVKVLVIVVFAAFSLFYLSQSSQSATRNYIVSDLQQQKEEAIAERERLEVEANRLKALSIIQEEAENSGMEQVSE